MSWFFYLALFIVLYFVRRYFRGGQIKSKSNQSQKIIIVTGSSAGLGKITAYDLLSEGATVIFACRDEKKTMGVINAIRDEDQRKRAIFMKLDLSSIDSVMTFIEEFRKRYEKLDILVNNAGALCDTFQKSKDGIELTIHANHIGHMILTNNLLDYFNTKEGRIINVSSRGHKRADYTVEELKRLQNNLSFDGEEKKYTFGRSLVQYGNSKVANIYFTQALRELLEKNYKHIKTASLHPGVVDTEFSRFFSNFPSWALCLTYLLYPILYFFLKTEYDGAQTQLELCYCDFAKIENGEYYSDCVRVDTFENAKLPEIRQEFMKYSWMLIDYINKEKYVIPKLIK